MSSSMTISHLTVVEEVEFTLRHTMLPSVCQKFAILIVIASLSKAQSYSE